MFDMSAEELFPEAYAIANLYLREILEPAIVLQIEAELNEFYNGKYK